MSGLPVEQGARRAPRRRPNDLGQAAIQHVATLFSSWSLHIRTIGGMSLDQAEDRLLAGVALMMVGATSTGP